jgi:hypothetical protein
MDIRMPIGLLFSILGVVLGVYGLVTINDSMYNRSLGMNVNLWSGACLVVFGAFMLGMAIKAQKKKAAAPSAEEKKTEAPRA